MIYAQVSKSIDFFIESGDQDSDLHRAVVLQSMALREIISLYIEILTEKSAEIMMTKSAELDELIFEYHDIAFGVPYGRCSEI